LHLRRLLAFCAPPPTTEVILELGGHRPDNTWIFDALLDGSYEFDLFGRVRRSVEASHADTAVNAAARDAHSQVSTPSYFGLSRRPSSRSQRTARSLIAAKPWLTR
jgi:hypothetical protein